MEKLEGNGRRERGQVLFLDVAVALFSRCNKLNITLQNYKPISTPVFDAIFPFRDAPHNFGLRNSIHTELSMRNIAFSSFQKLG